MYFSFPVHYKKNGSQLQLRDCGKPGAAQNHCKLKTKVGRAAVCRSDVFKPRGVCYVFAQAAE